VDLGCWPGGWLQIAARLVGPEGRVVGVDLAALEPLELPNVTVLCRDLADPTLAPALLEAAGGPVDVLLSDAAPKLTGIRATDRAREEALLESIEGLVAALLRPGGSLLVKLLEGPESQTIARRLKARFARARTLRPDATRKGSSERYLLGRDFRS